MLTPAEAEQRIREHVAAFPSEDCPLADAAGRILRQALRADRDLPPFDRVTLDGYAVRASALAAGTRIFQVAGTQAAGVIAQTLGAAPASCIEVMTGAVLPREADCVVPYEATTRDGATMTVAPEAMERLAAGHAIHRRGSDHAAGATIVPAGTRLTGREIAVAAACGYASLTVAARPKIVVVATGDELVDVGSPVSSHQIRRSNDYALRAGLLAAGYPQVERFHLRDVRHEIEHRLWHILTEFDVVLISGGISKGRFDFLPSVLDQLGVKKIFQGVAQRPGKPMWFGVSPRRTPVFALPGNPVSAYTCLHRYVLPALAEAGGAPAASRRAVALAAPLAGLRELTHFVPVRLASGPGAELLATPEPCNTSGDFAGLVGTDGFVELPPSASEFPAGQLAAFWPWV
jgi:molybdopterin molybdotransferase